MKLKRQRIARDKIWRAKRDIIHQQDIEARKCEREQKKKIKALQKANQPIPSELQTAISDSEAYWKADQLQLNSQLQLQEKEKEEEKEITFILDTVDDKSLQQQNYIALSESSGEEMDLSNSSSEKSDYSL